MGYIMEIQENQKEQSFQEIFTVLEMGVTGSGGLKAVQSQEDLVPQSNMVNDPVRPLFSNETANPHIHQHYLFDENPEFTEYLRQLPKFPFPKYFIHKIKNSFLKLLRKYEEPDIPSLAFTEVHVTIPHSLAKKLIKEYNHKSFRLVPQDECSVCWNFIKNHDDFNCRQCDNIRNNLEDEYYTRFYIPQPQIVEKT